MKRQIFYASALTAMLVHAVACNDDNKTDYMPGIQGEAVLEKPGPNVRICDGSVVYMYYEPSMLKAYFRSPAQGFDDLEFLVFSDESKNYWDKCSDKYDEYAKYYGDTAYFDRIPKTDAYSVSAMPLNSINVTADKDFDSDHPAGTSLNDIFLLKFASADNLVKSGYDTKLNIARDPFTEAAKDFEEVQLSDFEPLNLLHYLVFLSFSKLPEQLGTYEFTITFDFGKDPVSGREVNVPPAVIKAEFTEKDHVTLP